ncbi:hypothetical protein [Roseobacter sp. MH60115]|uniref:hypothetical protein n=1 Tax=Roseobacter sp. MH60115 TaxID=2785324 RepID=UPI0018A30D4E|nr:hypothetical protein [Roseobacter sp. MH60115]
MPGRHQISNVAQQIFRTVITIAHRLSQWGTVAGCGIFMSASGRFDDLMPGSPDCGRPMNPT